MKALVIGAEGQLGADLCAALSDTVLSRADLDGDGLHLDIRDGESVMRVIADEVKPDVVFNTAAAHNVLECDQNPKMAFAVNATGARNLALACREAGARLVHVSTDYVFGDAGTHPYVETDLPEPLSAYALSKLTGELLLAAQCGDHVIVRTAAIYGAHPCRAKAGRNFIDLMLHLAETRGEVKVVTDEITTPTYTVPLARQIRLLAEKGEPGLYHATCQGACSWYEFAKMIFEETGTQVTLREATSTDFPSPVRRPSYSVLENKHAQDQGLDIMPPWQDALRAYLMPRKES